MPSFIDQLVSKVEQKAEKLAQTFYSGAEARERDLRRLITDNWHRFPAAVGMSAPPAFAVDGSIGRANLANGAYLFVAQALLIGKDIEETEVEVEILRGSAPESKVKRFSDLLLQWLEVKLARDHADRLPEGGGLFLDGALYGQLPQLYPLTINMGGAEVGYSYPEQILDAYLDLFDTCRKRRIYLISVAKTSRVALLSKILQRVERGRRLSRSQLESSSKLGGDAPFQEVGQGKGLQPVLDIPDSEALYRWTHGAGYSTPVILGRWGFGGHRNELLKRQELRGAHAIVSFFLRLSDFDDPVRIDLPAFCVGKDVRLGDLDAGVLEPEVVSPIVQMLAGDYGGLEVYNALLYAVDKEVRLKRSTLREVYLKVIGDVLGHEIRLDRSERRF